MEYAQPKYNGSPTIKAIANGLGTLGRYGDSYMVHAAEGETVVPAEILDANPELKQQLFWQMRMMGIKDPNRYVVGSNLNSINPVTGQPEFFFKKIFRAVKKVFKKVLPIAAPIIGNLIAPGIGGIIASGLVTKLQGGSWGDVLKSAALSHGIGALGQGIGGAFQAAGAAPGTIGGGFLEGLQKGALAPFEAGAGLFAGTPFSSAPATSNPLAQGILGPTGLGVAFNQGARGLRQLPAQKFLGSETLGKLFPSYRNTGALEQLGIDPSTGQHSYPRPKNLGSSPGIRDTIREPGAPDMQGNIRQGEYIQNVGGGNTITVQDQWGQGVILDSNQVSQLQSTNDLVHSGGEWRLTPDYQASLNAPVTSGGQSNIIGGGGNTWESPSGQLYDVLPSGEYVPVTPEAPSIWSAKGATQAALGVGEKLITPGILAGLAYLTAEKPEENPDETRDKLAGEIQRNKYDSWLALAPEERYTQSGLTLLRSAGIRPSGQSVERLAQSAGITLEEAQASLDSFYGPQQADTGIQQASAISGIPSLSPVAIGSPEFNAQLPLGVGPIVAARGGEITGPGSGTSDSIPARLSDGEFVMTADAVRGAGNGNRNLGAARMYDMMSRYERGVA